MHAGALFCLAQRIAAPATTPTRARPRPRTTPPCSSPNAAGLSAVAALPVFALGGAVEDPLVAEGERVIVSDVH